MDTRLEVQLNGEMGELIYVVEERDVISYYRVLGFKPNGSYNLVYLRKEDKKE